MVKVVKRWKYLEFKIFNILIEVKLFKIKDMGN
jgi:hypothetical protein